MTFQTDDSTLTIETIAELIATRQVELGLTDLELASAIGYQKPNVIAMLKAGSMRFPLNKVIQLAEVLRVTSDLVLRLTLSEQSPELWTVIHQVFSPMKLTETETNLIRHLRQLASGREATPIVFPGAGVIALIAA